jgi:hypothetical protein
LSGNCTPCGCGAPSGSMCTSTLSLFTELGCSGSSMSLWLSSAGDVCTDIQPPGRALMSKAASELVYTPGTCEPSGGETSSVMLTEPMTFCCREPPIPK